MKSKVCYKCDISNRSDEVDSDIRLNCDIFNHICLGQSSFKIHMRWVWKSPLKIVFNPLEEIQWKRFQCKLHKFFEDEQNMILIRDDEVWSKAFESKRFRDFNDVFHSVCVRIIHKSYHKSFITAIYSMWHTVT